MTKMNLTILFCYKLLNSINYNYLILCITRKILQIVFKTGHKYLKCYIFQLRYIESDVNKYMRYGEISHR
jgi:hypothetical protein